MGDQSLLAAEYLADVRCEKCGSDDIRWRYHKTCWPYSNGCGYGNVAQPSGEHLHGYCQRCHFDFFEDVIGNV